MGRISVRLLCLSHSWFGVISASLWHLFLLQKSFCYLSCLLFSHLALYPPTHPATRRRSDVVMTSLCMSQWHRRYVSNETPNDVSVVRLHGILLERRDDVSRGRTTTSHQCVSSTSQKSLKWNTQRRLSGTSPRRLSGTYAWLPISTSLRRLLLVPNERLNNVAVVRLHLVSGLRCCDALLLGLYYAFKLFNYELNLIGFHVSFKYQIKRQNVLVPTRRETRRVGLQTSRTFIIFKNYIHQLFFIFIA